ncbi:hypothetical protein [Alkalicoccus luteus]|uniref:Uncharacterized protein n=1 Tax=Alkalicoccus luteus TaxID=1237094 RepID=A0A969TVC8_9BACI|nr:hypothetical protein [Alkalicoccus luteus]NJP37972.1 hypothetical protein [Alkalicoccus luteus]
MRNFRSQLNAEMGETAASLFYSELGEKYTHLQNSTDKNEKLMKQFFELFEWFSLSKVLKEEFI